MATKKSETPQEYNDRIVWGDRPTELPEHVRPFTAQDWHGLEGAEEQPATATTPASGPYVVEILHNEDFLAVLDRKGIEIVTALAQASYRLALPSVFGALLYVRLVGAAKLAALDIPELESLGFTRIV